MECSSRWRLTDLFGYNFLSSCYTFHYSSRLPGAFTKMSEFNNPTARTRVVREPHRGVYDRAEAYKILDEGFPVCVTVTILDGLVLARSIFNHSMNYRSVVVLGTAAAVKDAEEKLKALHALSEHILPGRWVESRPPNEQELKATLVLRLPITEFSAKVRQGPPIDDEEDYAFPTWAGVIPLNMVAGEPISDPRLDSRTPIPAYARAYSRKRG